MATNPWGLPILTGAEQYSLKTVANEITNATNDALTEALNMGYPPVASVAARTALFPVPVQGNRVYRTDMNWEETYFGVYNASTNVGGARVAGWYPTGGQMPYLFSRRTTSQTFPTAGFTSVNYSGPVAGQFIAKGPFTVGTASITMPFEGIWSYRTHLIFHNPPGTGGIYYNISTERWGDSGIDRTSINSNGTTSPTVFRSGIIIGTTFTGGIYNDKGGSMTTDETQIALRYLGPTG